MSRIVFLLEEFSMKVLLDGLLPRLFPDLPFLCVPHEGKQDLEKSISRKLRAWREPGVRFVVVRDNDGAECIGVKARLATLCQQAGRRDSLVRLACQELEAWYLGDPEALAAAFGDDRLRYLGTRGRFREPDAVAQPSRALGDLVPEFQKVSGARRMAPLLLPERSASRSFVVFVSAVERLSRAVAASRGG
jgi:hypothetical protein